MTRYILLIVLIFVVTGCNLSPDYTRPDAPIPSQWPSGPAFKETKDINAPEAIQLKWQDFYTDHKLQKIIRMAIDNNRDLRVAGLNVERARALYGIQRAELLPRVEGAASYRKQHLSEDLLKFDQPLTTEEYNVNLGLAWEIDFFGRLRNLEESALQQYLATEQARRSAAILLVSQVANAYSTLAADKENLKLAQSTLVSQQEAFNLVQRRFQTGVVGEIDLHQAQTRVDAARGDIALYTRLVAQDQSALNLLAGTSVPDELLPADLNAVSMPMEISVGISSQVLLNRPDILQAENQLKAAYANIGAARAAFFPNINLFASGGTASTELSGLFSSGSEFWNFTPQIAIPVFDPRVRSAYKVTKADKEIAVAQYEKAIQQAFKDVVDALAVQGTVQQQLSAQLSFVEAAAQTYRLSNIRYTKGIDNYLIVIDSQRSLYAAQQALVSLRLGKIANQIRLYAVLGGGSDSD